jgi:hypothetical protein
MIFALDAKTFVWVRLLSFLPIPRVNHEKPRRIVESDDPIR